VQRLRWRSRRGMLELELALKPFVEQQLMSLDPVDLQRYAVLLEHDDWDLFDWLQGRSEPDDRDLVALLHRIRAANAAAPH
jgi:antitoxin CptB